MKYDHSLLDQWGLVCSSFRRVVGTEVRFQRGERSDIRVGWERFDHERREKSEF